MISPTCVHAVEPPARQTLFHAGAIGYYLVFLSTRTGENGVLKVRIVEVRFLELSSGEVGFMQIRLLQVRFTKANPLHVRLPEIRPIEVGSLKICLLKVCHL